MAKRGLTKKVSDAVKGVFGDKQKEMTDREQKTMAAEIRGSSESLKHAMQAISFRTKYIADPANGVEGLTREELGKYQEQLALLIIKLDNARTTCTLDTRNMDNEMIKLCDFLQEAIRDGNAQTAHYIVKALCYGIGKGHKPLLKDEEDKIEEILKSRESRLATYVNICKQSIEMDKKKESIDKNTADLKVLLEKRTKKREETEQFKNEHQEDYKKIQQAGGHMNKLSGDAFTLASKMQEVTQIHKSMEQVKKEIALCHGEISLLASAIDKLNLVLNSYNMQLKEEFNEFLQSITEQELERYTEEISWVTEFDATLDGFYNVMEAAFNTPDLKLYVTKALQEYEAVTKEIDDADAAYGRYLEEEMLRAQQLENEEDNVLMH